MSGSLEALAQLIGTRAKSDQGVTLMLGAGASMGSGVPATNKIIEEIVQKYGQDTDPRADLPKKFDQLWSEASDEKRNLYLKDYLDVEPTIGYRKLAEIIQAGYINTIITFNFDVLCEKALDGLGWHKYREVIPDITKPDLLLDLVETPGVDLVIIHVHGSMRAPLSLRFATQQITEYPPEIKSLIQMYTRNDIIVCGYAMEDMSVLRSFSMHGNKVYSVDPGGVPKNLKQFQARRNSEDCIFDDEEGAKFDNFFVSLYDELQRQSIERPPVAGRNPFNFLASYQANDKYFLGRYRDTHEILEKLKGSPRSLHILGNGLVGKTSLIRAKIIPALADQDCVPIYIRRCSRNLGVVLARKVLNITKQVIADDDITGSLEALVKHHNGKHVVLFLDQFERTIEYYNKKNIEAGPLLASLCSHKLESLTVVPIVTTPVLLRGAPYSIRLTTTYSKFFEPEKVQLVLMEALHPRKIKRIMNVLCGADSFRFASAFVDEIIEHYTESYLEETPTFTLAHIHAICHLMLLKMASGEIVTQRIDRKSDLNRALDKALLKMNVISFVEDMPMPEEQNLMRNVLRIASDSSKETIATYVHENFSEIFKEST